MKLISLFAALAAVIGLFANAGRKLFQWLGPLFRDRPLPYGIATVWLLPGFWALLL